MIIDEVLGKAPPECQTHSEKIAFAFGWFKATEQIEAAVLAERELCAAICDDGGKVQIKDHYTKGMSHASRLCAAAIRARSQHD